MLLLFRSVLRIQRFHRKTTKLFEILNQSDDLVFRKIIAVRVTKHRNTSCIFYLDNRNIQRYVFADIGSDIGFALTEISEKLVKGFIDISDQTKANELSGDSHSTYKFLLQFIAEVIVCKVYFKPCFTKLLYNAVDILFTIKTVVLEHIDKMLRILEVKCNNMYFSFFPSIGNYIAGRDF